MWKSVQRAFVILACVLGLAIPAHADAPSADGRTYAVLVGVADYPHSPLPRTDVDARRIANALQAHLPEGRLRTHLLLNSDATRANVERALADVAREATERDEVIFFFSGHGGTEPDAPQGDEGDGVDETIVLYDQSLRDDDLAAMLAPVKSRMSIVALDSCFSGGFLFDIGNERGRMSLFSSDEDLTSAVPSEEAGGWLSLYLAQALEGRADGAADGVSGQARDGQLTALEIEMYVRDQFRTQQRIAASDPNNREVGYQQIDIKRTGVDTDDVFMSFGGPVTGGTQRTVLAEQTGLALPGRVDFASRVAVEVALEPGHTYLVETFDLAGPTDTVLELRERAGAAPAESDRVLAQNDDAGGSLASRVRFTPSAAGHFYASVRPYSDRTGGTFGLRVVELTESTTATVTRRDVALERTGIALPGTRDVSALPTVELTVEAGTTYVIETYDLVGNTDTVLELRRMQGATPSPADPVVSRNDDADGTLASRVRWTADSAGRYYALVHPYAEQTGGTFSLRVTSLTSAPVTP